MSALERIFDILMAFLWLVTYILALISTIVHKKPAISPLTQAIIAPLELAVVIKGFIDGSPFDFVSIVYILWTIIEITIIVLIIKYGYIKKLELPIYFLFMIILTIIVYFGLGFKDGITYANYIITIAGVICWYIYIIKKEYKFYKLNVAIFFTKFIADLFCFPPYFGKFNILVDIMIITLPTVDLMFIITWITYKLKQKTHN